MDYVTIADYATDEFIERKSRFIGFIKPVKTKAEAEAFIAEIKSKHYDATHNVSAYIVREERIERYSDDGEPQGTGGVPMLEVLKKEGLTDVCAVVTRYFGGILLGAGGLVRAYSHGCSIAVHAAQKILMCDCERLTLNFDYSLYGKINYLLPNYNIKLEQSDFADRVTLQLLVRLDTAEQLKKDLIEACNGQIVLHTVEQVFTDYPYIEE